MREEYGPITDRVGPDHDTTKGGRCRLEVAWHLTAKHLLVIVTGAV